MRIVMPACAGIHAQIPAGWIPASAGVTALSCCDSSILLLKKSIKRVIRKCGEMEALAPFLDDKVRVALATPILMSLGIPVQRC